MPAALVQNDHIPELAARIDSPAMLRVLRQVQDDGFVKNGSDLDNETAITLERLVSLGLVDPGFDSEGKPFLWVANHNGKRVLRHIQNESKLSILPSAKAALEAMPEKDRRAVLAAAESLQRIPPDSWASRNVQQLAADDQLFLLRVGPDLRVFFTTPESGQVVLVDIVHHKTLEMVQNGNGAGSVGQ